MGPEEVNGEGDGTPPGLIDRLGTKGIAAAAFGVIAAIVLASSFGGSDEPDPAPTTTATLSEAASTTTVPDGPQVPPIDSCTLLPDSDIESAMGLIDEQGNRRAGGYFAFGISEACRWETTIDETGETVAIELGPGTQDDFAPDNQMLGVTSVPAEGVGELAVWYPGERAGTMSAVERTTNGVLFVRLTLERADVDDPARRQIAADLVNTAIDRIRFGPPPPVEADLCELISDDDAERFLGPHRDGRPGARDNVFGGGSPKVVDLSQFGESFCQKLITTEIYVTAAMASASDFDGDARIDGVAGEPIAGVGDEAVWFADVPGTGSFASPHDTDILAVRRANAMFRIVIALPDLDPSAQQDAAMQLALAALNRLPGTERQIVVEHLELPDLSSIGFVDNLLARAEDDEWTIGEGLVATLRLFNGENSRAEVLRADELIDTSGTEIMRMARVYADQGPEGEIRDELQRLLAALSIPTVEVSAETAGGDASAIVVASDAERGTPSRAKTAVRNVAIALQVDEGGGYAPPPEFPDDQPYLPPHGDPWGAGECADASGNGWTAVPAYFSDSVGPFKAQVIYPANGFTAGWAEQHLVWTVDAVQESLDTYNANSAPCLHVLLSVHGGSSSWVLDTNNDGVCGIVLNTPMQAWDEGQFKQAVARDIAHCIIPINWPDQLDIASFTKRRWWNGALAEFLSNVVYPDPSCASGRCDLEWRLASTLATQEPTVPMMQRQDANWIFFQHLWWQGGLEGVISLVDQIPSTNDPVAHEEAMASVAGMEEVYHAFVEALTDSAVDDSGGGTIPYTPPSEQISVSDEMSIDRRPDPFGMKRLHFVVEGGMYGCFKGFVSDHVTLTYRPGSPGTGGDGWEDFPTDDTALSGEFVVVGTTTYPDGVFTIDVNDVNDDGECEGEEEEIDTPDLPCLAECGPSSYYQFFAALAQWFKEMIEAMMPEEPAIGGG